MERLKLNLQEAEQARVKLLERAKRHVSTDPVPYDEIYLFIYFLNKNT